MEAYPIECAKVVEFGGQKIIDGEVFDRVRYYDSNGKLIGDRWERNVNIDNFNVCSDSEEIKEFIESINKLFDKKAGESL